MLNQQIKNDIDKALKQQEKKKLVVLRNLWAELKNREIDLKRELNDQEIIGLINKQVKKLKEAILLFSKGGRQDLVEQNEQEISFLKVYLPPEISAEDLKNKVVAIVKAHPDVTNQGQLIGLCIRELKNQAESSQIAEIVKQIS